MYWNNPTKSKKLQLFDFSNNTLDVQC